MQWRRLCRENDGNSMNVNYFEEVRDFVCANVRDAVCIEDSGFALISASSRPGTLIVPEPVDARSLDEALEKSGRLSGLLSRLHGKKVVIVPEDIWRSRPGMTRPRILAHLGKFRSVFARKTLVKRVDKPVSSAFFNACHTYGDASARYRYGLFLGEEMVACASFSSPRTWNRPEGPHKSAEWVRYASLPDVRVAGGMGKLLNRFIEEARPDDVMSYADLEWTDGEVYRKLGFREESFRPPVRFVIEPESFVRRPMSSLMGAGDDGNAVVGGIPGYRFHVNQGSVKYRLDIP